MLSVKSNKNGVIFLIVLCTLLVVVSLAAVVLGLILTHSRITYHQTSRIQAYYAAMAGVNLAMEYLRAGTWTTGSYTLCKTGCTVNDSDIPYSVAIEIGAPGTSIDGVGRRITSAATYTYSP